MNASQITFEYLSRSATIASTAEDLDIPITDIPKAIFRFIEHHPESSYLPSIRHKLSNELTCLFYKSNLTAANFAKLYGIKEHAFIQLVSAFIDDERQKGLSDAVIDKLYRKLVFNRKSLGSATPKRVVIIIAKLYVSNPRITHRDIAFSYGICHSSISQILNRAINEGVLEPDLEDRVLSKSYHKIALHKHHN